MRFRLHDHATPLEDYLIDKIKGASIGAFTVFSNEVDYVVIVNLDTFVAFIEDKYLVGTIQDRDGDYIDITFDLIDIEDQEIALRIVKAYKNFELYSQPFYDIYLKWYEDPVAFFKANLYKEIVDYCDNYNLRTSAIMNLLNAAYRFYIETDDITVEYFVEKILTYDGDLDFNYFSEQDFYNFFDIDL